MEHWYNRYLQVYGKSYDEIAFADIIAQVRQNLKKLQSDRPVVTVSVIAYNEEKHLLACLWSLSEMKTRYPIEIIGVNNASQDRTADIYRAVGMPYYTETRRSPGYARSCGLHQARGKYFVNIDSDTLYPPTYVDAMVDVMDKNPRVVGVGGTWSYYSDKHHSCVGIFFYTFFRDCYLWLQSFKRPELSVRGAVFVHRTEEARKVGIRTHIMRGEDGALAFGLRQYGKLAFRRDARVRAFTGYRGAMGSGSLAGSFWARVRRALGSLNHLYTSATEYKDEESNLIKHE